MISFDINGAIVEFDEKQENYNSIRKSFKGYAEELSEYFFEECLDEIRSLKKISEKGQDIADKYIEEMLKKGVETIVSYDVLTIDRKIFKEAYCEKYLDYNRLFNNLKRNQLFQNKNKKNNHYTIQDVKDILENLKKYLYNDCFNIHYAVVDALLGNDVSNVSPYVDDENVIKSNALFNNYKDGFINKPDDCEVIKQIISLNPYRKDIYEFFIKEDGDFNNEIERLTDFLGYDIKDYKSYLMDVYTKKIVDEEVFDIEFEKEKIVKYSKYIGYDQASLYTARLDAILSFQNA